MERELVKFRGLLPYSSEMLGIYEPLIGWRSRLTDLRLQKSATALPDLPALVDISPGGSGMLVQLGPNFTAEINTDGLFAFLDRNEPDLFAKDPDIHLDRPEHLDGLILRQLQLEAASKLHSHPTDDYLFWASFWRDAFSKDGLNKRLAVAMEHLKDLIVFSGLEEADGDPFKEYMAEIVSMLGGNSYRSADYVFNREAYVARYLNGLIPAAVDDAAVETTFAKTVNASLLRPVPTQDISEILKSLSPTNLMLGQQRDALFSPIGILNLFRYYFYDLTTFLGPSVEHIWLGPNMTTELYEISTRRILQERTLERFAETVQRSEESTTDQDEISIAIKEMNQHDIKMGTSLTAGASILVAKVETSGSLNLHSVESRAREESHKSMRQQSSKLSTEIRNNIRTTFRTVTEATDSRSRRHIIENKEPQVVNFELRRKMRQVGIQAQSIGSQLCWQVYVDDPGFELGVSQLVHVAQKTDLSQFTNRPLPILPDSHTEIITVLMPIPNPGQQNTLGPIAASGFIGLVVGAGLPGAAVGVAAKEVLDSWFGNGEQKSQIEITLGRAIHQEFRVPLPEGYEIAPNQEPDLDSGFDFSQNSTIPIRKSGPQGIGISFRANTISASEGRFEISILDGKLTSGEMIEFQLRLTVRPTAAKIAAVQAQIEAIKVENAALDQAKERALRAELVANVRERVKLASGIRTRPSEDLREEERTVIYRQLISRLMTDAWSLQADRATAHLRSEFIKSIFDVDKMLYFVAPEWWQPRLHQSSIDIGLERVPMAHKVNAASQKSITVANKVSLAFQATVKRTTIGPLGAGDTVSWGGSGRADNYMITEDSAAARLGSSLGWLLQLDGDTMRNAFLNAPWVHAVIPIRAGHEREALEWLKQSEVEGSDGLGEKYAGDDLEILKAKYRERHNGQDKELTIEDVLIILADDVSKRAREAMTPKEIATGAVLSGQTISTLPTEAVFETGFNPLKDGFSAVPLEDDPFQVFSQWMEILPTDQIVAVKVAYDPISGKQVPASD